MVINHLLNEMILQVVSRGEITPRKTHRFSGLFIRGWLFWGWLYK